jgi:P-type conjugative transfer protein TrbL
MVRLKAVLYSFLLASFASSASALQLGGALAGHEADFQAAGAANGVDPLFLEAVAIEETGNGTSNALAQHNNVAGIMDPSTPNDTGFVNYASITAGINAEASLLQSGYISQGLTTISAIGQKYSPAGAANDPNGTNGGWGNDVAGFYQQLGGTSMAMGSAQPGAAYPGMPGAPNFTHAATPAFIDQLLQKFSSAAKGWSAVILRAATSLFWLLAGISVSWTLITLIFKRADLLEIGAELVRFIMTTGLFFWMLTNGPQFAQAIIGSLWQLGGQAAGGGNAIYPGDLITLGMQVMLNSSAQLAWLMVAPAAGVPFVFAVVILILCALIAVNMILLLASAWVVLYAGVIFLGFGGCRWTSDIAINYYRTVLGVGVSLLVMQLVIGIGQQFLQGLVNTAEAHPDIPGMATLMIATLIIAVLAHRLPSLVSNIAIGSGHHGGIGTLGFMSAVGAAMAASSIARSIAGAAGPIGAVGAAGMAAGDKIMERISAATGGGNGNGSTPPVPVRMNAMAPSSTPSSRSAPSPPPPASSAPASPQGSGASQNVSQSVVSDDPPESRPTAPDESRGLDQEPDFGIPPDDIEQT